MYVSKYVSSIISSGDGVSAFTGPVGVEELSARAVGPFICVGSEIIPLGLQQVGGKPRGTVAVIVFKGRGKCRSGNAGSNGGGEYPPPAILGGSEFLAELRIEQDIGDVWILVESFLDLAEEDTADDASAPPHKGDSTIVEIPSVLLGSGTHEGVALGI